MSIGWDYISSKQNLFLAFQMAQATIAQFSISLTVNFFSSCRTKRKKLCTTAPHFCNLPLATAHTFLARGHSQSACATVLSVCPHIKYSGSIGTFLRYRFARVGSISVHALQTKLRTFGGIFNFQILHQNLFSSLTDECSAPDSPCNQRATR